MLGRFIRIMLAIATAFVFTAQVEAATQHCARLAHAAVAQTKAETPSCHDRQTADAGTHRPAPHKKTAQDRCECIAVLSECSPVIMAAGSSRIEPYSWTKPAAETVASTEPAPDLRPPRA
jgi:hypothetical protein